MTHIVIESRKLYEDTHEENMLVIFHDGLSSWWEKEAQDHLEMFGFKNRQLRCLGDTNSNTIYYHKVVGNSPELCRGLDSHGFQDLDDCTLYH